jgi:hypothetical protein
MCVSLIGTTYAQTNLNVESWTANGLGGEDPDGWGTLNGFMAFGFPQTTFKETADPGEGLASVRMTSTYLPGASGAGAPSDTVGAMLFLGFYNLVTSENGIAYTSKPASVDFMYKSLPQGSDSGMVLVTLTHWDAGLATTMTDGFASMMFGTQVTSWTTASMPIIWISADTPDTLNIIATSSAIMLNDNTTYQMPGSELYLDNFSIVMTGVEEHIGKAQFKLYPNPAQDVLNIRSDFNGSATAVIYDVIGKQIRNISIEDGFTNVNTSEFKNGVYFYQIVDEKGLALSNGKFSIVR